MVLPSFPVSIDRWREKFPKIRKIEQKSETRMSQGLIEVVSLLIKHQLAPTRQAVPFSVVQVHWDGKSFTICSRKGTLAPRTKETKLD